MSNTLTIPYPPGGQLVCGVGQMPKVKIIGGQVHAECCMPPSGMKLRQGGELTLQGKRWVLSEVKEEQYNRDRGNVSFIDEEIISAGRYEFVDSLGRGIVVLFQVPGEGSEGTTPPAVAY